MLLGWKTRKTYSACDAIEALGHYRETPTGMNYRVSFKWMWSGDGFLDQCKRINIMRWSKWKNLDDTIEELQHYLKLESKSVRIQVCGEKRFGNVQDAINFLTGVQNFYAQ